jgi:hypothetical protein
MYSEPEEAFDYLHRGFALIHPTYERRGFDIEDLRHL